MSNPIDIFGKSINSVSKVYEKIHNSVDDWNKTASVADQISNVGEKVVEILNQTPGMTQAHSRDFKRATPIFTLCDGSVVKTWKNPVGVKHIFIADKNGNMLFGGFVGWIHTEDLQERISKIRREFT